MTFLAILAAVSLFAISMIPRLEFIRWEESAGSNDRATVRQTWGWFFWKSHSEGILYGSCTVWNWEKSGRGLGVCDELWMSEHWSLKEHEEKMRKKEAAQ